MPEASADRFQCKLLIGNALIRSSQLIIAFHNTAAAAIIAVSILILQIQSLLSKDIIRVLKKMHLLDQAMEEIKSFYGEDTVSYYRAPKVAVGDDRLIFLHHLNGLFEQLDSSTAGSWTFIRIF